MRTHRLAVTLCSVFYFGMAPTGADGRVAPAGAQPLTSILGVDQQVTAALSRQNAPENRLKSTDQQPQRAVPDYVAYRHLISVTAIDADAPASEEDRRNMVLARLGLADSDRIAYLVAVATVRAEIQRLDRPITLDGQDVTQLDRLREQRGSILDQAAARVLAAMSASGRARLTSHINEYVKPRIRMHTVNR
jgi:hypothetical protein